MRQKILSILIAIDIWVMYWIFFGKRGETMSAAAWNAHITGRFWGWTHHLIDLIFYPFERNHCCESWMAVKGIYQR